MYIFNTRSVLTTKYSFLCFRRACKIKRILEKSKHANCLQRSKVILFMYIYVNLTFSKKKIVYIYLFIYRSHALYPEIRLDDHDTDRLNANKDVQSQKNLSFPPISHDRDNQRQNNVRPYPFKFKFNISYNLIIRNYN